MSLFLQNLSVRLQPVRSVFFILFSLSILSVPAIAKETFGYLVKQPEEVWFQTEWHFAEQKGRELGVNIMKLGVPDKQSLVKAIHQLGQAQATGFVICTPDPRLGTLIEDLAKQYNMRVISVDDQLLDLQGAPMPQIPLLKIASYALGQQQGEALLAEIKKRQWPMSSIGILAIKASYLDTAVKRVEGALDTLQYQGIRYNQVYSIETRSNTISGSRQAAMKILKANSAITHWVVIGMNDNTVIGGIRATEALGLTADQVIGIGINGVDAVKEFQERPNSGFIASLLLAPDIHGGQSVQMLYDWLHYNKMPAPLTEVKEATLINRVNYQQILQSKGIAIQPSTSAEMTSPISSSNSGNQANALHLGN